ncbi:tRNA pseudouridine(38-40) synthase TruA [Faecalicatena contorta]|uniref:tRNA pseudouridine synthase A n=1 Tax=Faecalicatena contorta TaxID=39482 RepID=A0A315ZZF6_9FIRM|nr:tRNA pseudouridine(38-40) synthase TruA [Faecalicatena contorta]PWJ51041.1 tRNA pseudouridine38-40 synthase [Faecalicatena contorta]SUQ13609.1 tRNA pseudouridine38-40 synthase [Faecalicatena contorta]
MHNIKLTLEYDGSRYQGWQRLGKGESTNTVANKLLDVIHKMTAEDVELFCGARTEVGVHAYGQVVNFKTTSDMKPYEILHYLNRYLPMDIAVLSAEEMPERFHAALGVKSITYLYRIAIGTVPSVFDRKYTYYAFKEPDLAVMQQAALSLAGNHDFNNFSTVKKSKSTEKELYDIKIYGDTQEIQITLRAKDFLHNMPRMIIGTLLDIGLGKRKKECIEAIFTGEDTASAPCDPKGLFLQEVEY